MQLFGRYIYVITSHGKFLFKLDDLKEKLMQIRGMWTVQFELLLGNFLITYFNFN